MSFESIDDPAGGRTLTSGLTAVDSLTGGFGKGELIVLGGRPCMGKTSLLIHFALRAALLGGGAVLVFSLGESKEKISLRMLSALSLVPEAMPRAGKDYDEDMKKLLAASRQLISTPLYIDDEPALGPSELNELAHRAPKPFSLVCVDYLDLMRAAGGNDREQELAELMYALKTLAAELNTPLIVVAQLHRSLEARADKRPMVTDFRCKAVSQTADKVLLLFREEVYAPSPANIGLTEISVTRNSVVAGKAVVLFDSDCRTFCDRGNEFEE